MQCLTLGGLSQSINKEEDFKNSLQRDKLKPIQNMLKKKKFRHERSTGRLPSLPIVDETPSGKTPHAKQPK